MNQEAVNHPKHYNKHPSGIECIQIVRHMCFNLGNAIKYIWRAEEKGATLQDLEKARWYIEDEIELRGGKRTANVLTQEQIHKITIMYTGLSRPIPITVDGLIADTKRMLEALNEKER